MNLNKLKDLAVDAAKKAGLFLIENKVEEKKILSEDGRDIKLILDQETEKIIRSSLAASDIEIMGEEFGGVKKEGK